MSLYFISLSLLVDVLVTIWGKLESRLRGSCAEFESNQAFPIAAAPHAYSQSESTFLSRVRALILEFHLKCSNAEEELAHPLSCSPSIQFVLIFQFGGAAARSTLCERSLSILILA